MFPFKYTQIKTTDPKSFGFQLTEYKWMSSRKKWIQKVIIQIKYMDWMNASFGYFDWLLIKCGN